MNIKYARISIVFMLTLLIAGGSVMWQLESSPPYATNIQQSHTDSQAGAAQKLGASVIETDKQDHYQELETKLATLEALLRSSIMANIANNGNAQEFAVSDEDDSFNSGDIGYQTQAREAEVQRLVEQQATYFAQVEEQHRMQEVDAQWGPAIEQNMWESFGKSGMDKTTAINDIDCRTDMCIVEIVQSSSGTEDPAIQDHDLLSWVSANAGVCEFAISGGTAGEDPDAETVQRVYLTNCKQT